MIGKYQTMTVPVTVTVPDHWTAGDVHDELWSVVNDTVEDTMLSVVRSGGEFPGAPHIPAGEPGSAN